MCGINGIVTKNDLPLQELISTMNSRINHRGPDASGITTSGNIALGHVRLSIIDLSTHANQPFQDESGDYQLVYNGEVYNYEELKNKHNFTCSTSSDTEVIFEGLKRFGSKFVKELNGMFAFAFLNKKSGEVLIGRDRLGIKPLYVFQNDDTIAFSSELKGLKCIEETLSKFSINAQSINSFLHLGYIPKPLTIYNEITKFPPGYIGTIKNQTLNIESYWTPEDAITPSVISNEADAKKELDRLIHSSVDYRLKSDVPFGTFLSGGVDSSLISAIAQKHTESKINTFTMGFNNPKFNEAGFAKDVANHIGSNHHEFMVTEDDAKELVEDIIHFYDEPYGDSSAIPTMLVSKLARQHVKMTLSGDGGDELFHGYGFYNWANRLSKPAVQSSRKLIGGALSLGNSRFKRISHMFTYPKNQRKSHIFSQEQYYFTQEEIQNKVLIPATSYPDFMDQEHEVARKLSAKEKQSVFDLNYYLRDDLLTKVDIASMRYSLESRVPLLDHRIVEFALNVDENLKIKNGDQKYLLKQVLYDYVPKEMFNRPKRGFSVPLEKWLKEDLDYLIKDNLSKESVESVGLVHFNQVQSLLSRFNKGESYLFTRIWSLVVLHAWFNLN